jgi:hypothetical protein
MSRFITVLQRVDKRILFGLVFLSIAIPMIRPFPVPMTIPPETRALYDFIEKLKPGDIVVIGADWLPAYRLSVQGGVEAIFVHLMRRNARVAFCSFYPDGPMLVEQVLKSVNLSDKKYGVDYVNLGYRAGGEGAVAQAFTDFHATFPKDFRGTPVSELELMKSLRKANDMSLAVLVAVGGYAGAGWVRQLVLPYQKPLACLVVGTLAPAHQPYYQAKQIIALLSDIQGSAQYESLVNRPGVSSAAMGSQFVSLSLILCFMAISNVIHFVRRRHKEGS